MIYFRSIRYQQVLNSSYFLDNGSSDLDFELATYHIGDAVQLMIEVEPEVKDLILDCADEGIGRLDTSKYLFVPFTIVDKRHTFSFGQERGRLRPGHDIYLQAKSWGWEDIFKWLTMGERPSWISEEEEQP